MDNKNIHIDSPHIQSGCIDINLLNNLVALSSVNNVNIFKHRDKWILKDKRKLIKECENKKKKKINEICNSLKSLSNNNSSQIKIINDNLINDIEKIDSLIETIEKNDINCNKFKKILNTQTHYNVNKDIKLFSGEKEKTSILHFDKTKKYIEIFSN